MHSPSLPCCSVDKYDYTCCSHKDYHLGQVIGEHKFIAVRAGKIIALSGGKIISFKCWQDYSSKCWQDYSFKWW